MNPMAIPRPATRLACAIALASILASCATVAPMQPILRLDGRNCTAAPTLDADNVTPLIFEKPLTLNLDQDARCIAAPDGKRSTYVILALSDRTEPYVIGVTSAPRGAALFSPRLLILDAAGTILRERHRDAFMFHGTTLYAGMRAYPGDRYLMIASDPASVGQQVSQIIGTTQARAVPAGRGIFFMHSGSERGQSAVLTHNGSLTVTAQSLPRVN